MIDIVKFQLLLKHYKADFQLHWKDEIYKWKAVKQFQDNWDIEAENFGEMFKQATSKAYNLLDTGHSHPRSMIIRFSKYSDELTRAMFRRLFDEETDLAERVLQFQLSADELFEKVREKNDSGHDQNTNAISTYLWFMYPDKYFKYTYEIYKDVASAVGADYYPRRNGSADTMIRGMQFYDELRNIIISDTELCSMVASAESPDCYRDVLLVTTTVDVGFYIAKYYPSKEKQKVSSNMDIDYLSVLDFVEKYFDYRLVDTVQNQKEITVSDYEKAGQPIIEVAQKIANVLSKRYDLSYASPVLLFSKVGSDRVSKRRYLCISFKYAEYKDNPINISIFAEKTDEMTVLYRIGLDIQDDATPEALDQYHSHFNMPINDDDRLVYVGDSNKYGRPFELTGSSEDLRVKVQTGRIRKVGISCYVHRKADETNEFFHKEIMKAVRAVVPFYQHVLGIESPVYFPSLEEYDPGITVEMWKELLQNPEITYSYNLAMFKMMTELGGEATCARLAKEYGAAPTSYVGLANTMGMRIHKYIGCPLFEDADRKRIYTIMFFGRYVTEDGTRRYSWKLRPELEEALEEMDLSDIEMRIFENVSDQVVYDKNLILYGPPGTGKTYKSAIYAVAICDGKKLEDLADYDEVMRRYRELKENGRIAFTTFHQSYGYEEFIEGIKPVVDVDTADVSYTIEPGSFKKFCSRARNSYQSDSEQNAIPYVFIIDEINRGNISKIFGELITLIETTKRDGMKEALSATLPYSGESFCVPENVYILGTMNTADRSIALMDTALRRRFNFVEMMPDVNVLKDIGVDHVGSLDVVEMLRVINERITFLYDREHTIGHAFFTGLAQSPTIDTLATIFKKSIIPLLQEYFYEDYKKIQLVLGDNAKEDECKFIKDSEIKPQSLKGDWSDVLDLSERKYEINEKAFYNIESYIQII